MASPCAVCSELTRPKKGCRKHNNEYLYRIKCVKKFSLILGSIDKLMDQYNPKMVNALIIKGLGLVSGVSTAKPSNETVSVSTWPLPPTRISTKAEITGNLMPITEQLASRTTRMLYVVRPTEFAQAQLDVMYVKFQNVRHKEKDLRKKLKWSAQLT